MVLALVGSTGTGKSAVAMDVARDLDAEIVALDAFTVYRGMDVGTAKPSVADRLVVAHHLVDVLEPHEECTVRWFQGAARDAIDDVLDRGRTPLLVGGSGLYFRAVVDALEFPPTDPEVRAGLERRFAGDPPGAHAALAAVDPEAAARIDPGNLRRSVRALEVLAITGRRFSSWRTGWDDHESIYRGLRVVGVGVPQEVLAPRLDARVDVMVEGGLIEECRSLATLELSSTARQAIGYAEVLDHLSGGAPLPEAVDRIKARTRRYAARQARWFRADPRVQWAPPALAGQALRAAATPR